MKRFATQLVTIALVLVCVNSLALEATEMLDDSAARELLGKKCIQTGTSGVVPTRFDTTISHLSQPDLIQRIQGEYRKSVSRDGTIDYPIVTTGKGTYYYINEKNQRTDIVELCRRKTTDSTFDMVYHAKGKRYFGKYEVLIHVRAIDVGSAGTAYTVSVHAYPHNGLVRFFARRLGTVDHYFQRKTQMITRVSKKICTGMDGSQPFTYKPPSGKPLPTFRQAQQRSEAPEHQSGSRPPACWDLAGLQRHI